MRQQRLGRQAAGDDPCRRGRLLHTLSATAAGIARADGHANPELGGHHVEPLGPVLADPVHLAPAAGAGAVGDVDHLLDALQVRRQRAAVAAALGGRLALRRWRIVATRRRWRRICAEGQRKLTRIDALDALPEARPPQVVDDLLELRDAGLGRGERGVQFHQVGRHDVGHTGIVADALASRKGEKQSRARSHRRRPPSRLYPSPFETLE